MTTRSRSRSTSGSGSMRPRATRTASTTPVPTVTPTTTSRPRSGRCSPTSTRCARTTTEAITLRARRISTRSSQTVFFSCGNNSFGHPSNRAMDALRSLVTDMGIGADMYIANNPCDPFQADGVTPTNYTGVLNSNGTVSLHTTGAGTGYVVSYDTGSRTYTAHGNV